MAFITSVVLSLSAEEAADRDGEVVLVGLLNDWLVHKCGARLKNVAKFAGGRTRFPTPLYAGAFNHLPYDVSEDGLLGQVRVLPWRRLDQLQLFVRPETSKRYLMVHYSPPPIRAQVLVPTDAIPLTTGQLDFLIPSTLSTPSSDSSGLPSGSNPDQLSALPKPVE